MKCHTVHETGLKTTHSTQNIVHAILDRNVVKLLTVMDINLDIRMILSNSRTQMIFQIQTLVSTCVRVMCIIVLKLNARILRTIKVTSWVQLTPDHVLKTQPNTCETTPNATPDNEGRLNLHN